ncbi:MAG: hypothetical protein JNJ48_06695 [Phycisphaerae bacterium]|nr:hypothetical protein [Phycisphaerae bacterium]
MMKRTCGIAAAGLGLGLASAAWGNPIVNGDFQTGTIGPSTSAYALSGSMLPPETYNVVSFDTIHPSWVDFFDHTLGNADGRYMIINGSDSGVGPAWAQTVAVTANTVYDLSAWFASLFPQSVATLQWRLVGDQTTIISGNFVAPLSVGDGGPGLGVWVQQVFQFNSGSNTSLSIQLWDVSGIFQGNDYAVDDISLTVVPAPAAAGIAAIAGLAGVRRRRRN